MKFDLNMLIPQERTGSDQPRYVLRRGEHEVRLEDLRGLPHAVREMGQKGLTVTGTLLGSPAHMAPECIDGHPADERSDLFSLGTVLYWIATGSLP